MILGYKCRKNSAIMQLFFFKRLTIYFRQTILSMRDIYAQEAETESICPRLLL